MADRHRKMAWGCALVAVVALMLGLWGIWAMFNQPWAKSGLGDAALAFGNEQGAVRRYQEALQRCTEESATWQAELHVKLGNALAGSGDMTGAEAEYGRAAELAPGWAAPLVKQSALLVDRQEPAAALDKLEEALRREPRSTEANLAYGWVLGEELNRHEEAIPHLEKAVELQRRPTEAAFALGQAYEATGHQDRAIEAYWLGASNCDDRCRARLAALGHPYDSNYGTRGTSQSATPSTGEWEEDTPGPAAVAGFMVLFFGFYLAILGVVLAFWVLQILSLWDCALRDFPDPKTRAIWSVLIVVGYWIGAIVYLLVVYRTNDPPRQQRRK